MRTTMKFALGALAACGLAVAVAAPASAQVVVPAYPSCYDAYGNYVYAYPYCAAPASSLRRLGWGGTRAPVIGAGTMDAASLASAADLAAAISGLRGRTRRRRFCRWPHGRRP